MFVLGQIILWLMAAIFGLSSVVAAWLLWDCLKHQGASTAKDMAFLENLWVLVPSVAATLLAAGWAVAEIVRR